MALLKFINSEGVENEVDETSIAAEIMRDDARFILVSIDGERQPVTAIEPPEPAAATDNDDEPVSAIEVEADEEPPAVTAAIMRELMSVEKKKLWKELRLKSFRDYLNKNKVRLGFGTTKFYDLKKLLLAKGDKRFNALMEKK